MFRGYPKEVRTDNGPEFTCQAFMTWAQKHGIKHILIESGSPTQNAYIESFNGTFRDECLDENWFESLEQARQSNLTPADVYFGRGESILEERRAIKEQTIQSRRLQHQIETV